MILHWNWKRILLELVLETLVELNPSSYVSIIANLTEYLQDFYLESSQAHIQMVFSKSDRQHEPIFSAIA